MKVEELVNQAWENIGKLRSLYYARQQAAVRSDTRTRATDAFAAFSKLPVEPPLVPWHVRDIELAWTSKTTKTPDKMNAAKLMLDTVSMLGALRVAKIDDPPVAFIKHLKLIEDKLAGEISMILFKTKIDQEV